MAAENFQALVPQWDPAPCVTQDVSTSVQIVDDRQLNYLNKSLSGRLKIARMRGSLAYHRSRSGGEAGAYRHYN